MFDGFLRRDHVDFLAVDVVQLPGSPSEGVVFVLIVLMAPGSVVLAGWGDRDGSGGKCL